MTHDEETLSLQKLTAIRDYLWNDLLPGIKYLRSYGDYGDVDRNDGISYAYDYILHEARSFHARIHKWKVWYPTKKSKEKLFLVPKCCDIGADSYSMLISRRKPLQNEVFCPNCGRKWIFDWKYGVMYLEEI